LPREVVDLGAVCLELGLAECEGLRFVFGGRLPLDLGLGLRALFLERLLIELGDSVSGFFAFLSGFFSFGQVLAVFLGARVSYMLRFKILNRLWFRVCSPLRIILSFKFVLESGHAGSCLLALLLLKLSL
jgi:hypothetical protein